MQLGKRAVYSIMNEKLKQVQKIEEKELKCVISYVIKNFKLVLWPIPAVLEMKLIPSLLGSVFLN